MDVRSLEDAMEGGRVCHSPTEKVASKQCMFCLEHRQVTQATRADEAPPQRHLTLNPHPAFTG